LPSSNCHKSVAGFFNFVEERSYQIPHPFAKMSVFENLLVAAAFAAGRPEAPATIIASTC